jgi:hypothetical protein
MRGFVHWVLCIRLVSEFCCQQVDCAVAKLGEETPEACECAEKCTRVVCQE